MNEIKGKIIFKGDVDELCHRIVPFLNAGFYLTSVDSYLNWPYFWKRIYVVKLHIDLIMDDEECVIVPSTQDLMKELS